MASEKERKLRKHKRIATGLFFVMAIIYGGMVYLQHHQPEAWMGYVEAFAEAGMVGALADWFAVTALFKHPLGIPIPHTNLIENKKNDLGKNLGKFVNDNFISPQTIRPYIEKLDVAKIMADWFEKSNNKALLTKELAALLDRIVRDLDDNKTAQLITQQGVSLLKTINYQKILSSGTDYLLEKQEHLQLLDNLLPELRQYIQDNEQLILKRIAENRPLIAFLAGKKISREITQGIVSFIQEIENDPQHFVRKKLTTTLLQFSYDLKNTPKWDQKIARLKDELITADKIQPYAQDAWKALKNNLLKQLENPNSKIQVYLDKNIDKTGKMLREDKALQHRLNHWIRHFSYRMILKNKQEIEDLISRTVEGWEGKELSEKLELEVGKDLQFIRINGTLVGGLVGLLIYIFTHLFV